MRMEQVLKRSEEAVAATLLVAQGSVPIWVSNWQFTFRLSTKCGRSECCITGIGEIEGWVDCSHRYAGKVARRPSNKPSGPKLRADGHTHGGPAEILRDSGRRTLRPTGEDALQHDHDIVQQNAKGRERDEHGKHQGIVRADLATVE